MNSEDDVLIWNKEEVQIKQKVSDEFKSLMDDYVSFSVEEVADKDLESIIKVRIDDLGIPGSVIVRCLVYSKVLVEK